MKLTVYQNDELFKEYDVDLFDSDADDDKIFQKFRKMWREMISARDSVDCPAHFTVKGTVDTKVTQAIALGMNIGKFVETIAFFCNAYLPKAEGAQALRYIFDANCLTWPKARDQLSTTGAMQPYLPSNNGIYSFHFYDPDEWARHDMVTLANASEFVPYDIQDYSMICKAVPQCPKGARPMIWLNPYIVKAFTEAHESGISKELVQTYISSFIIVSALNNGDIDDAMAIQLWYGLADFLETEDASIVVDLYHNAEHLLASR